MEFMGKMLGPLLEHIVGQHQQHQHCDGEGEQRQQSTVEDAAEMLDQMFLSAMSSTLGTAYRSCSVIDDAVSDARKKYLCEYLRTAELLNC